MQAAPRPRVAPERLPWAWGGTGWGPQGRAASFLCRCFAVGSKDMSTWVFGAERWDNLIYYALGGHKDAVVACFFEASSLDVRARTQHP